MAVSDTAKGMGRWSINTKAIRQHPMMSDRISVPVLGAAVVLNICNLLVLIFRVHRATYPVPVHYSSLVGFDQVGSWLAIWRIGLFALAVTLINGVLAAKAFQRNRLASFFLLLGSVVVGLLCLIITSAFAVIV
ncbi:MAG TPA: hypothetical protein VLF21_01840 [Candidatus Saccharimonadales bacterium]|nr:hypothetical protein [Candidatus Saccharimonadales bacterium]